MAQTIHKNREFLTVSLGFLTDNKLNIKERTLYMILASYCQEGENWCCPSLRQELAVSTGLVPRTILVTLRVLEEKGYIKIEKQYDSLGALKPNKYILLKKL